jgi:RHS repeat-associated protein
LDANVGFYYLRARYYNQGTGRFITTDPEQGNIFDPVSLHRYLYANANPVDNHDPSGRLTLIETVKVLGALATVFYIASLVALFKGYRRTHETLSFISTVLGLFGLGAILYSFGGTVLKEALKQGTGKIGQEAGGDYAALLAKQQVKKEAEFLATNMLQQADNYVDDVVRNGFTPEVRQNFMIWVKGSLSKNSSARNIVVSRLRELKDLAIAANDAVRIQVLTEMLGIIG